MTDRPLDISIPNPARGIFTPPDINFSLVQIERKRPQRM